MRKTSSLDLAVFCAASLVPAAALAQPSPAFGEAGQLAISSDTQLSLEGQSYSGTNAPGSNLAFVLEPAADYFVVDNLSLGGFVEYAHTASSAPSGSSAPSTSSDTFGIGPRVGYDIRFSDSFSFWPKAFFSYATTSTSTGGASGSSSGFGIGLYAPVLFHPAPHFFLGLGPNVSTQLSNSASGGGQSNEGPKATTYGIALTLGGWVGLGG